MTSVIAPIGAAVLPRFELTSEFIAQRDDAIAAAALIARVSTPAENETANTALSNLLALSRQVESARKKVKEPVLDLGRGIDAVAKEAVAPIEAAAAPVKQLICDYQAAEREKARQEALRIERERREAEEKAAAERRAEEARIAEETRKAMEAAKSKEDAERLQRMALEAQQRAAEDEQRKQQVAAERAAQDKAATAAPVARGQVVREDWEIEVFDIHKLYLAHPAAVELKPRLTVIRELINAGVMPKGVNARKVTKAGVRTAGRTIDV